MTEESTTPLFKKLGIKPGARLTFLNPPDDFRESLNPLPAGVKIIGVQKPLDVIVFFPKSSEELENKFAKLAEKLTTDGRFWIAWPKKSSGQQTELSFETVQQIGLNAGLVDNKVCSISKIFSGLCFVIRVKDRA